MVKCLAMSGEIVVNRRTVLYYQTLSIVDIFLGMLLAFATRPSELCQGHCIKWWHVCQYVVACCGYTSCMQIRFSFTAIIGNLLVVQDSRVTKRGDDEDERRHEDKRRDDERNSGDSPNMNGSGSRRSRHREERSDDGDAGDR